MPEQPPREGPERDRWFAHRVRHGPRIAQSVGEVVDRVVDREAKNRMRRFARAVEVLRRDLDSRILDRLRPVDLRAGELVVDVDDGPLLAELTQHHAPRLLAALVAAGSGVSKLRFRMRRRRR